MFFVYKIFLDRCVMEMVNPPLESFRASRRICVTKYTLHTHIIHLQMCMCLCKRTRLRMVIRLFGRIVWWHDGGSRMSIRQPRQVSGEAEKLTKRGEGVRWRRVMPNPGAELEVEVDDGDGEIDWRQAVFVCAHDALHFSATVCFPDGSLDHEFTERYSLRRALCALYSLRSVVLRCLVHDSLRRAPRGLRFSPLIPQLGAVGVEESPSVLCTLHWILHTCILYVGVGELPSVLQNTLLPPPRAATGRPASSGKPCA